MLERSTGEHDLLRQPTSPTTEDKRERGFDLLIDVWGADHHGYVAAACRPPSQALGGDPDQLELLIMQFVHLVEGGERGDDVQARAASSSRSTT